MLKHRHGCINNVHREKHRTAVIYSEGRQRYYAMSFDGRIYKILRTFDPATQLRFNDLQALLKRKYGNPDDHSHYPDYARSPALKLGAIRRGEGRARLTWSPSGQGWDVVLSWTREMGLTLAYVDRERQASMRSAFEEAL